MTEWRGRARSILGQGVERLKDGALQWVTRISRGAAEVQSSREMQGTQSPRRLKRAWGLLRLGVGMGRNGARRVRGRVSRTVRWAGARIPGALLAVVGRPQSSGSDGEEGASEIRASVAESTGESGSVRTGFFSGPGAARRPGRGDPSQLRAFGRDAWTLFAMWEVRPGLRPQHLSAPSLELRVRALGGAEVLRRRVELRGSLYLDGLVPGATYVVELWWTDGPVGIPVAMPPASVTLAMGPPAPTHEDVSVAFGAWEASGVQGDARSRQPALVSADVPSGLRGGMRGPQWPGADEVSGGGASPWGASSPGSFRSGSGGASEQWAGSPGPRTPGSGSGSGWAGQRSSPGASWQQGGGGPGAPGHSPTSPGHFRQVGPPVGGRESHAPAAWTPSDAAALIRPAPPPAPAPAPPRTGSPGAPGTRGTSTRAASASAATRRHPPAQNGTPSEGPTGHGQRGRKGRARRRRAQREAAASTAPGSTPSQDPEAPGPDAPPVRRGFFQEVPSGPPRPPGRRHRR